MTAPDITRLADEGKALAKSVQGWDAAGEPNWRRMVAIIDALAAAQATQAVGAGELHALDAYRKAEAFIQSRQKDAAECNGDPDFEPPLPADWLVCAVMTAYMRGHLHGGIKERSRASTPQANGPAETREVCCECGATSAEEAATKCLGQAASSADDCHGNSLWNERDRASASAAPAASVAGLAGSSDLVIPWQLVEMGDRVVAAYLRGELDGEMIGYLSDMLKRAKTLPTAARDVLAERRRQSTSEGWTLRHDDEHLDGSLAAAAAAYINPIRKYRDPRCTDVLGWPKGWTYKPKDRRSDLVRGAALAIAEIERRDRLATQAASTRAEGES